MISKAEIVRLYLKGETVFDIGGTGYGEPNAYESELAEAWSLCKRRVCVDFSDRADISVDLNVIPLPKIDGHYDIATAFDVLEHLEHPIDVLRWIPSDRLIVTLPNALSCIARRMEEKNKSKHLYSFTPYTASVLLGEAGWGINDVQFQFGKWSLLAKAINAIGSMCPSLVGTGIVLFCDRTTPTIKWRLR
ncbi:MAG: class I SAM-dependent methyltransferase [Candidatus Marinimicrobia bacterium]|nr:class I SAM-dependent methyltransferase [Candidatus Neomarinimicrobiota bacterium]